jgi:hypothetical protein
MEDKIVNLKVNSDLKGVNNEFAGLKKGIDDSKKSAGDLNETIGNTSKKGNVFSNLTAGVGQLIPGFKGAEAAGQGVLKTLFALVANPIGAVIAALALVVTTLFKAFTSTKEGGEALASVFAGVSATIDVLRDRFLQLVNGIARLNLKEIIASFTGLGAEIKKDATAAASLTKSLQEVNDAQRDLSVSRSKLNRDLAASKELITDENATFAQKKKALNEVRVAEERQSQAELKNAKKRFDSIKAENDLSNSSSEALQKQADAQNALIDLQTQSANNRRSINKQNKTIESQEKARLKTISDEAEAENKVRSDKQAAETKIRVDKKAAAKKVADDAAKKIDDDLKAAAKKSLDDANTIRIALEQSQETPAQKENREFAEKKIVLDANNLSTQLLEQVHQENLNKITTDSFAKDADAAIKKTADEKVESDKRKEIARLEAEAKLKMLGAVSAGLSIAAQELGESTAAGKIAAVAAASISTYTAIAGQLAAFSGVPIPGYAIAQAIVTGATGLLQVKKILAVKTPKGGGGGSAPTINAAGGGPAAPAFNVIGASPANQLAQTIGAQNNVPIKAFVVSSDVTTAQALDRNIIKSATLG